MDAMASWMPICGTSGPGGALSFLGMWIAMTAAMMLPSLVPMLARYRTAIGRAGQSRPALPIALAALGYFCAWTLLGIAVLPLEAALAAIETQAPAVARVAPLATGIVVLMAGALQFSAWKRRRLACCRAIPGCRGRPPVDHSGAWRFGLQLGSDCVHCCAGLTAILLAAGIMELRAMALVTAAITVERLVPPRLHAAEIVGAVALGVGSFIIVQAAAIS
jgi:predicted metal-binding membrane protein